MKIYLSGAVQTKTDSDITERNRKTIWFGMKPGKTLNIEKIEDGSRFLDWVRMFKLDIRFKCYGFWK